MLLSFIILYHEIIGGGVGLLKYIKQLLNESITIDWY